MKTLAQKEYLSDPSSIFDIPQNQILQQLTTQFQVDASEAVKSMLELQQTKEVHNQTKVMIADQQAELQRQADLRDQGEEEENSNSDETDSDDTGSDDA